MARGKTAKLCPIGASGFALPACGPDSPLDEEDDPECVDAPDKNYRVLVLLTSRFLLHKYLYFAIASVGTDHAKYWSA
jgi:hypothetical protein